MVETSAGTTFERHYAQVLRYLRRRTRTAEEAEDLAQAVFADAAERLREFEPGSTPVLAWLDTAAQRRLARRLKKPMPRRVEEGVRKKTEPEDASIASLAIVYERGYRRFLRVAEGLVHDVELARDVVQDAFARAIQARFDYRGDGSLEGWVWRIVVNTARNAARDRATTTLPLHDLADEPRANGAAPDAELSTVLAALPERQRLVLFLRYYADLDYRRIGEALEIQPGTVGATLNHAHEAVRRSLEATRR